MYRGNPSAIDAVCTAKKILEKKNDSGIRWVAVTLHRIVCLKTGKADNVAMLSPVSIL